MLQTTDLKFLADKHRELDFLVEENKNKNLFISSWSCEHPFYKKYFRQLKIQPNKITQYNYIRENNDLTELISYFHKSNNEPQYQNNEILTSGGSTTIISSFFIWLRKNNIKEVYYIPPLYFTFHFFSKALNISLRPVTSNHLYEKEHHLNLPNKKCILLLTDPIWYSGFSIPKQIILDIVNWQERTGSTVFIDGSFQYFKWDCSKYEYTSLFNKEKTLRLVCPTKSVAIHGFRFSYLLLPAKTYDEFDFILDNLTGSSNPYDIEASRKCIKLLSSRKSNTGLIQYTCDIFKKLKDKKIISTSIAPNCGYFVFAKLKRKGEFQIMNGEYFEQRKYKNYVRINLLSRPIGNL